MHSARLKAGPLAGRSSAAAGSSLIRTGRPTLPGRFSRKDGVKVQALAPLDSIRVAGQLATTLSLAVGAWWLYSNEMMLEQVRGPLAPLPAMRTGQGQAPPRP
jgi:hypothetical protein